MTRASRWWPVLWRANLRKLEARATRFPGENFGDEWIGPECKTKAEALRAASEELKRRNEAR